MTTDIEQLGYTEIMPHVGELADELFQHPDEEVSAAIEELLDWVDVFHREGLQRIVELIKAWRGEIFLEQAEKDEIIGPFLATYDLNESNPLAALGPEGGPEGGSESGSENGHGEPQPDGDLS